MPDNPTDYLETQQDDIVQKALAGDKISLTKLISDFIPMVRYRAAKFKGNGLEIDDLFQEGMIGFLSAVEHYNTDLGTPFSAYAKICIDHRINTAVKTAGRLKHKPLSNYISIEEAEINTSQLQDAYEAKEQVQNINEQIHTNLSKLERKVLALFLNGLSYEQIASKLFISPKSVDNSLQRVRKKLKD